MFNKKYKEEINKLNNIINDLNNYIDKHKDVFELYANINELENDIHIIKQNIKEENNKLNTIQNNIRVASKTLSDIQAAIDIDWLNYIPQGYYNRNLAFYDYEISDMIHKIKSCDYELTNLLKYNTAVFMLPSSEWNKHHNKHDNILYLAIMTYIQSANGIISQIKYNNYNKKKIQLDELLNNINKRLSLFNLYIPEGDEQGGGTNLVHLVNIKAESTYKLSCLKNIQKERIKQVKEQEAEERRLKAEEQQLKEQLLTALDDADADIIKQEIIENQEKQKKTRAGWVYVISNDDMKENIYKIGITRRENYLDRIEELSNASHAFKFKVHGVVWSEDCFRLENDMHKYFANRNINPVHFHKEHFYCTLEEIEDAFKSFGYNVKLDNNILDEEYIESQKILSQQGIKI